MIETTQPSVIWRFDPGSDDLDNNDEFTLRLREGAQLIAVDRSHRSNVAALWFLLPEPPMAETGEKDRVRRFRIVGTGHPIPAGYRYCGSTGDGVLVWHVFERIAS